MAINQGSKAGHAALINDINDRATHTEVTNAITSLHNVVAGEITSAVTAESVARDAAITAKENTHNADATAHLPIRNSISQLQSSLNGHTVDPNSHPDIRSQFQNYATHFEVTSAVHDEMVRADQDYVRRVNNGGVFTITAKRTGTAPGTDTYTLRGDEYGHLWWGTLDIIHSLSGMDLDTVQTVTATKYYTAASERKSISLVRGEVTRTSNVVLDYGFVDKNNVRVGEIRTENIAGGGSSIGFLGYKDDVTDATHSVKLTIDTNGIGKLYGPGYQGTYGNYINAADVASRTTIGIVTTSSQEFSGIKSFTHDIRRVNRGVTKGGTRTSEIETPILYVDKNGNSLGSLCNTVTATNDAFMVLNVFKDQTSTTVKSYFLVSYPNVGTPYMSGPSIQTGEQSKVMTYLDGVTHYDENTLPAASSQYVGEIIQYTGPTTTTIPIYKNGYFYKCKESSVTPGVYNWEPASVQDAEILNSLHLVMNSSYTVCSFVEGNDNVSDWIYIDNKSFFLKYKIEGETNYNNDTYKLTKVNYSTHELVFENVNLFDGQKYNSKAKYLTFNLNGSAISNVAFHEEFLMGKKSLISTDVSDLDGKSVVNMTENTSIYAKKGHIYNVTSSGTNNFVDAYSDKVDHYETMPAADAHYLGNVVQYVGETTTAEPIYIQGRFYRCELDSGSYVWKKRSVQDITVHLESDTANIFLEGNEYVYDLIFNKKERVLVDVYGSMCEISRVDETTHSIDLVCIKTDGSGWDDPDYRNFLRGHLVYIIFSSPSSFSILNTTRNIVSRENVHNIDADKVHGEYLISDSEQNGFLPGHVYYSTDKNSTEYYWRDAYGQTSHIVTATMTGTDEGTFDLAYAVLKDYLDTGYGLIAKLVKTNDTYYYKLSKVNVAGSVLKELHFVLDIPVSTAGTGPIQELMIWKQSTGKFKLYNREGNNLFQLSTLPETAINVKNDFVQYIGATNEDRSRIQGHFYRKSGTGALVYEFKTTEYPFSRDDYFSDTMPTATDKVRLYGDSELTVITNMEATTEHFYTTDSETPLCAVSSITPYQTVVWSSIFGDIENIYLKRSGGTMTGSLTVKMGDKSIIGSSTDNYVRICGGTTYENGASLILKGNSNLTEGGCFKLFTGNNKVLFGSTDGKLYWCTQKVMTIDDTDARYLKLEGGTMTGDIDMDNHNINNIANLKELILNTFYPVGSRYIQIDSITPAEKFGGTWALDDTFNNKALWCYNDLNVGTDIVQGLPLPKLTFSGSSATTGSSGNHNHNFTGTAGTTGTNGAHKHSRGDMEISGTFGSVCCQGGNGTGAFSWKRDNNAELSGDNQSRGTFTFTASKNWSGETSEAAAHTHSFTPAGTIDSKGSHTHTVTAKGTVSVTEDDVYKQGYTQVQPPAKTVKVWKRTA